MLDLLSNLLKYCQVEWLTISWQGVYETLRIIVVLKFGESTLICQVQQSAGGKPRQCILSWSLTCLPGTQDTHPLSHQYHSTRKSCTGNC